MDRSAWKIRGPRKDGTYELWGYGEWYETFPDLASAEIELVKRKELEQRTRRHAE